MSRGGDGTLEGVQGAMPAISLMEGRSTAIFANDRPVRFEFFDHEMHSICN